MTVKKEEVKKEDERLPDDIECFDAQNPENPPDIPQGGKAKKGFKKKLESESDGCSDLENTEQHESEHATSESAPVGRKSHRKNKPSSSKTIPKPDGPDYPPSHAVGSKKNTPAAKPKGSTDDLNHIPETAGSSFVGKKVTGRSKTKPKRRKSVIPTGLGRRGKRKVTINESLSHQIENKSSKKETHKTKAKEARVKKGERVTEQQDEEVDSEETHKTKAKEAKVKKGERVPDQQDEEVDSEWTAEKIVILKRYRVWMLTLHVNVVY